MGLDQVLVDRHRVSPELHLRLDPRAVRLARRGRGRRGSVRRRDRLSRWPGWGNLAAAGLRAGGHPGGICRPRVVADRLAIHPRAPGDLPMRRAALEQRVDSDAQMRLQDVHSFLPRNAWGGAYVPLVRRLGSGAVTPAQGGGIWGGHRWGSLGGRRGVKRLKALETENAKLRKLLGCSLSAILTS